MVLLMVVGFCYDQLLFARAILVFVLIVQFLKLGHVALMDGIYLLQHNKNNKAYW